MDWKKSSISINWSRDYGSFKFIKGNRDINEKKINKIIKSVENGINLFKYCPILVTEKMGIIDGQHRFWVCKTLKLPIHFVTVPDISLRQIAELNSNMSIWKTNDFINCYIDIGKEDYKILKEFRDKYKPNISIAINILQIGKIAAGGSHLIESLKDGDFKINHYEYSVKLMETVKDYKQLILKITRDFIVAIDRLMNSDEYNHKEVINKLKRNESKIDKKNSPKDYCNHIEELYNKGNSKRQIIYK